MDKNTTCDQLFCAKCGGWNDHIWHYEQNPQGVKRVQKEIKPELLNPWL